MSSSAKNFMVNDQGLCEDAIDIQPRLNMTMGSYHNFFNEKLCEIDKPVTCLEKGSIKNHFESITNLKNDLIHTKAKPLTGLEVIKTQENYWLITKKIDSHKLNQSPAPHENLHFYEVKKLDFQKEYDLKQTFPLISLVGGPERRKSHGLTGPTETETLKYFTIIAKHGLIMTSFNLTPPPIIQDTSGLWPGMNTSGAGWDVDCNPLLAMMKAYDYAKYDDLFKYSIDDDNRKFNACIIMKGALDWRVLSNQDQTMNIDMDTD